MSEPRRESDQARARRYAALEAEAPVLDAASYRTHSRRALLTGGVAAIAAAGSYRWLLNRPDDGRANSVLRKGHEFNEALWRRLTRDGARAPTFDRSESSELRVNGRHGIRDEVDLDSWEMIVEGPDGSVLDTHVLSDITAFPKVEMTIEHKCVEGWSHVVTWGGTRFSDFAQQYGEQLGQL
ncbi:MAG: hypothetical protein KJN63_06175, partial [Acidimicrobiia bacterium]|nr:hypothetical protein [Acidimicrobiia bacterium]